MALNKKILEPRHCTTTVPNAIVPLETTVYYTVHNRFDQIAYSAGEGHDLYRYPAFC